LDKYKQSLLQGEEIKDSETTSQKEIKEKPKIQEKTESEAVETKANSEKIIADIALTKEKQLSSTILKCTSIEQAYKLYDKNLLRMK